MRTNLAALSPVSEIAGIAAMIGATAVFVVSDTFLKLAAAHLPPFELVFLRGLVASLACGGLILWRGQARLLPGALAPRALLRAAAETLSVLCYIVALAHMPIADIVAILQTAPLVLILGAAVILRDKIGAARVALALLGFAGAVLVVQPGAGESSSAALLALGSALLIAARDLIGRTVPGHIPVSVVTFATLVMETVAGAPLTLAFETPVWPGLRDAAFVTFAALLLVIGQVGILLAYRLGQTATVAPFFYSFALWALLSGLIVWGQSPNALALLGILLIVASGVAILWVDRRKRRRLALAAVL